MVSIGLNKLKLSENAFLAYIIIMSFAKAVGLDAHNKFYYYVAGVGFVAVLVSIIASSYSLKELLALLLFGAFIALIFYNTRKLSPILLYFTFLGAKNVSGEKLAKPLLYSWIIGYLTNVILTVVGIIPMHVRFDPDHNTMRYGMGYPTDNQFAIVLVIISILWGYYIQSKRAWMYLLIVAIALGVYALSDCRFGLIMIFLSLGVWIVVDYCGENKKLTKAFDFTLKLLFLIPLIISMLTVLFVDMEKDFWIKMNHLFTNRVMWIENAYTMYKPVPFGQSIKGLGWNIDNAYAHILIQFGYIYFILFIALYIWLFFRYDESYVREKALAFLFLVAGVIEQFMQNCVMNVSLLVIAVMLWNQIKIRSAALDQK